jgi:hypothetical protein
MNRVFRLAVPVLALLTAGTAPGRAAPAGVIQQTACPIIDRAAHDAGIPVGLLTRLVWIESRFRPNVVSPKGAQGIAQFMPETALERGLADPFDPEQAIPKAARLLLDLRRQFGNLGLAAAAYNAGATRVAEWLAGTASLPPETRSYVLAVTGRMAEDWAADKGHEPRRASAVDGDSCAVVTATLLVEDDTRTGPIAPWGVQLAGNFSKAVALASFARVRQQFSRLLGDRQPMILGGVLRSRGTRPFYRVMLPAATRAEADRMCRAILAQGGACVALRS